MRQERAATFLGPIRFVSRLTVYVALLAVYSAAALALAWLLDHTILPLLSKPISVVVLITLSLGYTWGAIAITASVLGRE